MKQRVLVTLGLNELPVAVAAYRLSRHLKMDCELPAFTILHSDQNKEESERVRALVERQLDCPLKWGSQCVEPYSPDKICRKVKEVIGKGDDFFHLHYTGGTKAMGIHAMQALAESARSGYKVSYLSPRDHRLRDALDKVLGDPEDERLHWNLTASQLAELHGYETEFLCFRSRRPYRLEAPVDALIRMGVEMFPLLGPDGEEFQKKWLRERWEKPWKEWDRWPKPPCDYRERPPVAWFHKPGWENLTTMLQDYFGGVSVWRPDGVSGSLQIHFNEMSAECLAGLHQFLRFQCCELWVFDALRKALIELGWDKRTDLRYSTQFVRSGENNGRSPFEIDVLAVIGYQLLAISCTVEDESHRKSIIKQKAFEILHRARQFGGGMARALLICRLPDCEARELADEVTDDVGGRETPFFIWGRETVSDPAALQQAFRNYLEDDLLCKTPVSKASV